MAEGMNGYSLADIGALMGSNGGFGGGMSWIAILFLFVLLGGNGGWGFGGRGEQYATSNDVNRGFDNQNQMANQREILSAVTAGTAQSVAATNQAFHDNLNVIQDKYGELTRDIYGVSGQVAQVLANQNACCCDTKMLIQETSAQNRYDALLNTNAINANILASNQKVLDALAQNKIDALENKIRSLELAQATQNNVKYPTTFSYNAGPSPFCGGCGCGCGF
jgi:hypothetical protein